MFLADDGAGERRSEIGEDACVVPFRSKNQRPGTFYDVSNFSGLPKSILAEICLRKAPKLAVSHSHLIRAVSLFVLKTRHFPRTSFNCVLSKKRALFSVIRA